MHDLIFPRVVRIKNLILIAFYEFYYNFILLALEIYNLKNIRVFLYNSD